MCPAPALVGSKATTTTAPVEPCPPATEETLCGMKRVGFWAVYGLFVAHVYDAH